MAPIDLRRDTVTQPTPEMRAAMAEAEVGDDVYGEDPTVNRLEQQGRRAARQGGRAVRALGDDGATRSPCGSLTERGDEVLVERRSHICALRSRRRTERDLGRHVAHADGEGGHIAPEQVRAAVAPHDYYKSRRQARGCSRTRTTSAAAPCSRRGARE